MQAPARAVRRVLLGALSCLAATAVQAGQDAKRPGDPHIHGMAHLHLSVEGRSVTATLVAPAATMIGFEHRPVTEQERSNLELASQNLASGDAMIRLNAQAECTLAKVKVSAPLTMAPTAGNSGRESADPEVDLSADYRFDCARPERLDSAALGVFSGFPFLQRVLVYYRTKDGRGRAELTPSNPVVTFVPF